MFSYASDIEPHVVFMAVCVAVVVLTVPLWFLTYRRLRATAATTGRKVVAVVLALALLVPAAFSGWMIRGYQTFADAVASFEGPTTAQQAAAENGSGTT